MSARRSLTPEEQRQRMLRKCAEQASLLQIAQERMQKLSASRLDLCLLGTELTRAHSAPVGSVHVGSGSFACVWASKDNFNRNASEEMFTDADGDTDGEVDQYVTLESPFRSALKVLQLPIGQAKASLQWPPMDAQMQLPLAQRGLEQLYSTFDELRWQRLFIQEAEAMVACDGHPAIARVLGWCMDDYLHLPTLAMEYAGSANLWHTMFGTSRPRPNSGPLPVNLTWQQATAIYLQLLDAVDWMHHRLPDSACTGRFCLHRDISPGNVVISWPQGRTGLPQIKLVDFGLSELIPRRDAGKLEWLQVGVAVGPDVMFIDPLMWVCRLFGHGTDIFGMAHLLLLLLFGIKAAHNYHVPTPSSTSGRNEEFNAICKNRTTLRNILRSGPKEALSHPDCPLLSRWQGCPEHLLRILSDQCVLCTTAGEDALRRRPSSRQLLTELASVRSTLPADLAAWLPTTAQISAGIWPAPRAVAVQAPGQKK